MDEQYRYNNNQPLLVEVSKILSNLPQVWADLTLCTEETIELPSDIISVTKSILSIYNAILLIGANLLQRSEALRDVETHLRKDGFILSIEKNRPNLQMLEKDFDVITCYETDVNHFVLLRRKQNVKNNVFINVDNINNTFPWIDIAKKNIEEGKKIVFYGQDDLSGVIGLVNCLRRELGPMIHGLLITDPKAPAFDPNIKFYRAQIVKNLAINVFQDGQWGTYRHFLIKEHELKKSVEHAFGDIETIGDLSSVKWLEGYYYDDTHEQQVPVHVFYSALNFRDVVVAAGRVPMYAVAGNRLTQQYVQGFEFAGKTENGSRVMGTLPCQCIATKVYTLADLLLCIPDEWSMEEAVTVPIAYCTVYLAFIYLGKLKYGESVLIHAGTGGVGQAAIHLALHYGCNIFTTVGSQEKREFIKKLFPQLKDSHIGSTRNTTFEEMIHRETNGKGVDLVLNSLADEKLLASIRCLGHRGRFLELGKYDIFKNTKIDMYLYEKEISVHGVMFDHTYATKIYKILIDLVIKGIVEGAVRPLTYCIFENDALEAANRYMAAGKHVGKVVIKIRDDPKNVTEKPTPITMEAIRRFICTRENVYVLVGGLGGFGLELADWLVLRGARKLVLVSRRGVTAGYQSQRIRIWESYGCKIQILTHDVTTSAGCTKILKTANSMGPVDAIFNLALVLKDAPFQQQTPETFKASFAPKAVATKFLDEISRELCPELRQFVVFSSISCGRGNASQSNYGMANSVMERICERRRREGYPGLAIQYGAIGDVGILTELQTSEMDRGLNGIAPQRIVSCLQALDKFLVLNAAIGSTFVVAEKKAKSDHHRNAVETVAQIIGVKNPKSVSYQMKLAELGMDSMMGLEIKQALERDFDIILNADEVKSLSFARLNELSAKSEQLKPIGDERVKENDA